VRLRLEWLSVSLAEIAGEALTGVRDATTVDAIVMASAPSRGDVVYTTDVDDLERLRAYFPAVRVLAV
jgi:predicted nuclease of predicted toxin-antitoxin system